MKAFYARRDNRLAWTPSQADALMATLRGADRHAIDPSAFLALIRDASDRPDRDADLTRAALAYARALSQGMTDPHKVFAIFTLRQNHVDLVAGLQDALDRNAVSAWLEGLAPQDAEYRSLSAAYLKMQSRASRPWTGAIPAGPSLHVGDRDPRTPAILAALAAQDSEQVQAPVQASPGAAADPLVWSAADAEDLRRYQEDHGLKADGIPGPNSLAMLSESPADRARRIAVNMERRRWLERTPPGTRIDVNTAAARLVYLVDGAPAWSTRVATGRPGHETPQLEAAFSRIVVNPPWRVPSSIAREEIDPKGPAYLASHHMRRVGGRIVQSPGPWAALGQVKFDMRDPYAIYLHDTPGKAVFDRSQRHLSRGCVRVEGAVGFARRLAAGSAMGERFDTILSSGETGSVQIDGAIPVRLLYRTVLVADGGRVSFRPDVYGWDLKLSEALGMNPIPEAGVEPVLAAPLGP